MPSEEPVSCLMASAFFMQIQHFASHCQEVFAAKQVGPLHSKSVTTQLHLLLPRPGTELPLTGGLLLCVKLQTRFPTPCPRFRVPHAHHKSGRARQLLMSFLVAFLWAMSFSCPPPQQCTGVALLTVWHRLSQNVALRSGEAAVNPVKGGSCNSVYDKQDLP